MYKYAFYLLIVIVAACSSSQNKNNETTYKTKKQDFVIYVHTVGELQAEKYDWIGAPVELRDINVYNVKITDIVPEGTEVQKGDYVGTLDKSVLETKLIETESQYEELQNSYLQAKIDTSMDLGSAREEIIDVESSLKEKKIELEQSKFEPPSTIRKINLEIEKLERNLALKKRNYELKVEQAKSKVKNAYLKYEHYKTLLEKVKSIESNFTVHSPANGIIIYKKERDKTKRKVGSTVSPWDPVIALLPDLNEMICKTYVNELDISKVSVGQTANIVVDAFPDKSFSGNVIEVANIGETINGSSVKSFEVIIKLSQTDSLIKPAMTTTCSILIDKFDQVLTIPIIALHVENELKYVYLKENGKSIKQEIISGKSDEDFIIIEKGIKENDLVLLTIPENSRDIKIKRLVEE